MATCWRLSAYALTLEFDLRGRETFFHYEVERAANASLKRSLVKLYSFASPALL